MVNINSYKKETSCNCNVSPRAVNINEAVCKPTGNFVELVDEKLAGLNYSIGRLEKLRNILTGNDGKGGDGCGDSKQPLVTFDYVWKSLPDRLMEATNRIFSVYETVRGMVYKDVNKDCVLNEANDSNHVHTMNRSITSLIKSLEEIEILPLELRGEEVAYSPSLSKDGGVNNAAYSVDFTGIWRNMPYLLTDISERLEKVENQLTSIFLVNIS